MNRSRPQVARLGALRRWRAELAAGKRKNTAGDFDDLQAAACNELAAYEAEQRGHIKDAERYMDRALVRLHGCYDNPDASTQNDPGPGRLLLDKLKAGAA